jgi:hypothetical protein
MNTVEIVLKKERGMRKNNGVVNLIKICCKHICKYHYLHANKEIVEYWLGWIITLSFGLSNGLDAAAVCWDSNG